MREGEYRQPLQLAREVRVDREGIRTFFAVRDTRVSSRFFRSRSTAWLESLRVSDTEALRKGLRTLRTLV
jgi:hypothetical protein